MTVPKRRPPGMPPPSTPPLNVPEQIGKYRVQRLLGSGGMATVFAALQEQPKRVVALKVMRPGSATPGLERRFRKEMEIMAKLRHPHIAQIFDAGTHDDGSGGMPYFVMEYIPDAMTITDFANSRKLDVRDRVKIFVKVCAGAQHGHLQQIVHRDLKPGNILVDANGEPKIIDYGVARATEIDLAGPTQQTEAGKLVGTVAYMSPEQVEARPGAIDAGSDVYALGVVLFQLLTGRTPYGLQGVPLHEACRIIREEAPIKPSSIKPEVKGDLETVLLTALEKDRLRRYPDAGALGRDLLRWLGDKPIKARRASPLYRLRLLVRRNRTATIATLVVLGSVTALGAGGFWIWRQSDRIDREREELARTDDRPPVSAPPAPATPPTTPATAASAADTGATDGVPRAAAESGRFPILLEGHTGPIRALGFAADTDRLFSLGSDKSVIVWDGSSWQKHLRVEDLEGLSGAMAVLPQGEGLFLGRSDGLVEFLDVESESFSDTPLEHTGEVVALAVSSGGEVVLSSGTDLLTRLWPRSLDAAPRPLRMFDGAVTALAFSSAAGGRLPGAAEGERGPRGPRGDSGPRIIAAGTSAGELFVTREAGRDSRPAPSAAPAPPDGPSRDAQGNGRPRDDGPRLRRTPVDRVAIRHLAFSPDGSQLVAATDSGRLRVERQGDEDEASMRWTIEAHEGPIVGLAMHPSGACVATAEASGVIRVWDLDSGKKLDEHSNLSRDAEGRVTPVGVGPIAYSRDGRWLALAGANGALHLVPVDSQSGRLLK